MSAPTMSARICAHMNKDHSAHLSLYSEHYLHFPANTPTTCLDITTTHLTLSTGIIPLEPPMSSLSDSRSRLKTMVYDAEEALGKNPYKLTRVTPPQKMSLAIVSLFVLYMYVTVTADESLKQGGWVQKWIFMGGAEGVRSWLAKWKWEFLAGVWGLHALETVTMIVPLLKGSSWGVWGGWFVAGLVEGFPAVARVKAEKRRVRREVRGEEKKKA